MGTFAAAVRAALVVSSVLACCWWAAAAGAHPICVDSTAPFVRPANAGRFTRCAQYQGLPTCIAPAQEADRAKPPRYAGPGGAEACKERLQSIACSVADQWAGHLFRAEGPGVALKAPKLCPDYCAALYSDCSGVSMSHSPFVNGQTSPTTIAALYPTSAAFCGAFADDIYCYSGTPYEVPPPKAFNASMTICYERVLTGGEPKVNISPVPGHDDLLLIGDLEGLIRIYRVDNENTNMPFMLHSTLLDIRSKVLYSGERGLLGVALHKNFFTNGRIYVSYSCRATQKDCKGGDSIVEEYRVRNPDNRDLLIADMNTRRRIFRLAQPFSNHNGGHILFSPDPNDPHLYLMMGDGGSGGDPGNRAQPLNTFFGKILRIDVDAKFPSKGPGVPPKDNPFVGVKGAKGLIWANGLRNPWRCSFDRKTYLMYCGDVGQNEIEEVDVISKGSNYGWSRFEGDTVYNGRIKLNGRTTATKPILTYTHRQMNGWGSVTGGYVIRNNRDSRLTEKYIFADLSGPLMLAEETPADSGQWAWGRIQGTCSSLSPLPCQVLGSIYSFGEMLGGDILIASASGSVFRVIEPDKCAANPVSRSPVMSPTKSPTMITSSPTKAPVPCSKLSKAKCRKRADCRLVQQRRCKARA